MSINRPDEDNGRQFQNPQLRELDTLLNMLSPAKRPGYLESAYTRCMNGNLEKAYLVEMAELLRKWSTKEHSFETHAEKLLNKNGEGVDAVRENAKQMMDAVFEEGASKVA